MNKALITGITGQDGVYLTEFLLNKDYEVYGQISGRGNGTGRSGRGQKRSDLPGSWLQNI